MRLIKSKEEDIKLNILEKILNYTILLIYAICNFIIMIYKSLVTLRNCFDLIGGLLYQPIIFTITLLILQPVINKIDINNYNSLEAVLPYIVILSSLMIIVVLAINAFIELIYYFIHKQERYNIIFSLQKGFYNYSLIVISLIAFWVAYDNSIDIKANLELLIMGCYFFLCVIVTDLYNFLIHSQNKVKALYEDILQKKKELF